MSFHAGAFSYRDHHVIIPIYLGSSLHLVCILDTHSTHCIHIGPEIEVGNTEEAAVELNAVETADFGPNQGKPRCTPML